MNSKHCTDELFPFWVCNFDNTNNSIRGRCCFSFLSGCALKMLLFNFIITHICQITLICIVLSQITFLFSPNFESKISTLTIWSWYQKSTLLLTSPGLNSRVASTLVWFLLKHQCATLWSSNRKMLKSWRTPRCASKTCKTCKTCKIS